MAPQVMCRCNHGVAVDYYALGILLFQCIFGIRPYIGSNRQEIRDKILAKQVQIRKKDIPSGWSTDAVDFVNHLIQRKPQNRLGNNGPEEVMNHPWFKDINWQRLRRKQIQNPFNPVYNPDEYQQQLNNVQEVVIPSQTTLLLKKEAIQSTNFVPQIFFYSTFMTERWSIILYCKSDLNILILCLNIHYHTAFQLSLKSSWFYFCPPS